MSLGNLIWDLSQEERISDLERQVKVLEEQMAMAAKWIVFLANLDKNFSCPEGNTDINKELL